jgi:hypothetical protein
MLRDFPDYKPMQISDNNKKISSYRRLMNERFLTWTVDGEVHLWAKTSCRKFDSSCKNGRWSVSDFTLALIFFSRVHIARTF